MPEGKRPSATQQPKSKSERSARWQPTAEEKADLTAIDAAIDRMRALTAPDPYVLTIPQDVEPRYHHSYRSQAQQWLCGTPFSSAEHESLQYQTFHFYEHGKQMYVQQNSRPQEPKAAVSEPRSHHAPGTGANTPTPAPKKKISLDAYKKKQSGQPSTPDAASSAKGGDATAAKQSALKGPIEKMRAETEEMLAAVAESEESNHPPRKSDAQPEKKDLKRKREERETATKDDRPPKSDKHSEPVHKTDQSLTQKARQSPSPAHQSNKSSKIPSQNPREPKARPNAEYDETKLPPRLSPGMPPRLSPLRPPASPKSSQDDAIPPLPLRLSPTIPENISNTLKARELYHNESKDEKAIKKAEDLAKRKSPVPRNGFRAISGSPAVRSDAEDRLRPITGSAATRPQSPGLSQDEDAEAVRRARAATLVVKLRYKKSQRDAIVRILKTRPTPSKRPSPSAQAVQPIKEERQDEKPSERRNGEREDDRAGKTVAQKSLPPKREGRPQPHRPTTAEKRPLPDEDRAGPSAKRRELNSKEPSTPARSDLPSPVANSSVPRHLPPTPNTRKDVLSLSQSMKREFSQESFTMQTPPAASATPSVNGSQNNVNGGKRPPASHPSQRTPAQQAWETEQKRLEVLGRELKHASSAHLNGDASFDDSSIEQTISAAKSLESMICYFLAFSCTDEASLAADPKQNPNVRPWRSMQGFYTFVKRKCEAFPFLSGLASALGISLHSHILSLNIQPHNPNNADSTALIQAYLAIKRATMEANAISDVDSLEGEIPNTFDNRSRTELPPMPEPTDPSRLLSGPYQLPIDLTTPPFRAARATYAALKEWLERTRVPYTFKLTID